MKKLTISIIIIIIITLAGIVFAQMHNHSDRASEPVVKTEKSRKEYLSSPVEFRKQLDGVFKAYLALQNSLSEDSLAKSKANAETLDEKLGAVDMKLLKDMKTHMRWMELSGPISKNAKLAKGASDLEDLRIAFKGISNSLISTAEIFGTMDNKPLYVVHCPMVKADWIQSDKLIRNPYHGKSMLACGAVKETISSEGIK
jgi:Cu(I)/Ag(I) efflux system membrane fusion protein